MDVAVREVLADELFACLQLRREVFCDEQGVDPAIERDGRDSACRHLAAVERSRIVGTLRLRALDASTVKLERMAVERARRGRGVGQALVEAALADVAQGGFEMVLDAQEHAAGFYARLGFLPEGEPFVEAGIPHLRMRWFSSR